MELDELKKSWNALDRNLPPNPVASDEEITRLIAHHKGNTSKSLGRIKKLQRLSILTGVVVLASLALAVLLLPQLTAGEGLQEKLSAFIAFIAVSLIAGVVWDWKTYRWSQAIHIDEMTVAEVTRRMTVLRRWTAYEMVAICAWLILFNVFNYWLMDYHHAPVARQLALIAFFLLFDAAVIYVVYKRKMYRHLNNIRKHIEELKDICNE